MIVCQVRRTGQGFVSMKPLRETPPTELGLPRALFYFSLRVFVILAAMDSLHLIFWIFFGIIVAVMMAFDLGINQRRPHAPTIKEAAIWSLVWIAVALLFNAGIWVFFGHQKALEFLTGYLLERTLSIDNMFVFILIFSYFGITPSHQPRVLTWGILGALLMRLIFILAGTSLIQTFHFTIFILGALLITTGVKIAFEKEERIKPEENPLLRFFKKFVPVTAEFEGSKFFLRRNGIFTATPLFATLLVIEFSDVVFALDSIPAILAVTTDTFIVYTSNIFAILGLRALFFLISGLMTLFRYLNAGVAVILVFVGVKMLISDLYEIPLVYSLAAIGLILLTAILASVAIPAKQ